MNGMRDGRSALPTDIRDLLVRRSERLKRPATVAESEDDAMAVAAFSLGDEEYAIALPALRAAIPLRAVTPVPRSSRFVIGITQFQGEVIVALSTAALLSTGWHVDPTILLIVDAGDGRIVALDCAQVPVATTISLSRYRQAESTARGGIACIAIPGRGAVNVIDVARMLESQDWGGGSNAEP